MTIVVFVYCLIYGFNVTYYMSRINMWAMLCSLQDLIENIMMPRLKWENDLC